MSSMNLFNTFSSPSCICRVIISLLTLPLRPRALACSRTYL
ncbi:MAG: hypothetical protein QXL93_01040 [Candidatus Nitrosocaldus sp.]